ncbi:MAG: hypothetical protein KIT58_01180 [Planctomycetota bacterium]|nr:hypothetical protein [Planctomycetota bacterium]
MSDTRLRELERRWKETGSPDDEAAYLQERVRVGDLTQERLELAAYCGHEGARRLVDVSHPTDIRDFVAGLARFGNDLLLSTLVVLARECLHANSDHAHSARAALDAKDRWINCPCSSHEAELNGRQLKLRGVTPADCAVFLSCQAPTILDDTGRPREDHVRAALAVVQHACRAVGEDRIWTASSTYLVGRALGII